MIARSLGALLLLAVPLASNAQATPERERGALLARAVGALERTAQARASQRNLAKYDEHFRKYTKRYFGPAFDWRYFKAQGMAESGLSPTAKSRVGARGVMQLMPSTYRMIQSARPDLRAIDDPASNIAAGIMHDRYLWGLWQSLDEEQRHRFMFASYNAGEGTINRALATAMAHERTAKWESVEKIAPTVPRWRYTETLGYVRRIDSTYTALAKP